MKLDELRSDVETLASDIVFILEPLCQRHGRNWARVMREELESSCPNFQLVLNYANGYYEEAEGDGDRILFLAEELKTAGNRLSMEEKSALYSLQQEVSLASTGPKRSLAQ